MHKKKSRVVSSGTGWPSHSEAVAHHTIASAGFAIRCENIAIFHVVSRQSLEKMPHTGNANHKASEDIHLGAGKADRSTAASVRLSPLI